MPFDSDREDDVYTVIAPPVTIAWEPVTMSHPEIGTPGVDLSGKIVNYEVVVEYEDEDEDTGFVSVMSVLLPPDQHSMTVPAEFVELSDSFKYEVLVQEESDNQTAVESCFQLAEK